MIVFDQHQWHTFTIENWIDGVFVLRIYNDADVLTWRQITKTYSYAVSRAKELIEAWRFAT